METQNKIIEILQHWVSYHYENGQDMTDNDYDNVKQAILDGHCQGKLADNGWWFI